MQRALSEHHGDATLLVNAAGYFIPKPFLDYDAPVLRLVPGAELRAVLPDPDVVDGHGRRRVRVGRSSTSAPCGRIRPSAATPSVGHSMQKAGLHALTHNLAIELAEHQIRVNAVAPAAVKTPALRAVGPEGRDRRHA